MVRWNKYSPNFCKSVGSLSFYKTNNETALYSNGEYITGTANVSWSSSTQPIYIGKDPNTVTYNGKLDDIRIYNRALSSEEVSALYRLKAPIILLK